MVIYFYLTLICFQKIGCKSKHTHTRMLFSFLMHKFTRICTVREHRLKYLSICSFDRYNDNAGSIQFSMSTKSLFDALSMKQNPKQTLVSSLYLKYEFVVGFEFHMLIKGCQLNLMFSEKIITFQV